MKQLFVIGPVVVLAACGSVEKVPSVPQVQYQEKLVPAPCIVQITPFGPVELEVAPVFDPAFTAEESKAWASEVRAVTKRNNARYEAAIEARDKQIEEHNRLEPKCDQ